MQDGLCSQSEIPAVLNCYISLYYQMGANSSISSFRTAAIMPIMPNKKSFLTPYRQDHEKRLSYIIFENAMIYGCLFCVGCTATSTSGFGLSPFRTGTCGRTADAMCTPLFFFSDVCNGASHHSDEDCRENQICHTDHSSLYITLFTLLSSRNLPLPHSDSPF